MAHHGALMNVYTKSFDMWNLNLDYNIIIDLVGWNLPHKTQSTIFSKVVYGGEHLYISRYIEIYKHKHYYVECPHTLTTLKIR